MTKKTLVLGASLHSNRYSNLAIRRLVSSGISVIALGRHIGKIEETDVINVLKPLKNIHTVSLYLNATNQKMYYDYVIGLQPKRVIFNPGSENSEFYNLLNKNHIHFEEACTLVLLSTNQY